MESVLRQFAASETAEKTDVLTGLGIDWTMLVLQIIAFGVLVWVLGKFVYPTFARILDERQAKIDASLKAAEEALQASDTAEASVKELMKKARRDAADIVAGAKTEAVKMVEDASVKAKVRSDAMLESAQNDIDKEVKSARQELKQEIVGLVAMATEKVVEDKADQLDEKLIQKALSEVQR